jgi:DNA invertase Pin-like site-specific DNA recombinase
VTRPAVLTPRACAELHAAIRRLDNTAARRGLNDTLVVVRLDRLARSVSHLLAVIEQLEAKGAHFRSLRDPIDTTTPQGIFSLQALGAVAQLERALSASAPRSGGRQSRPASPRPGRDHTLQQIAAQLEAMRERTPRGTTRRHPSSVKHLLERAARLDLARTKA